MHLSDLISLLHDVVQLTANHFVSTCFPFSSCVLLNFCLITKFFWQLTCLFAIFCSMDFTLGSYWSCKKQSQKQFHDLDPQQTHIWSQLWLLPCTMRTHDTGLESGLKHRHVWTWLQTFWTLVYHPGEKKMRKKILPVTIIAIHHPI